MAKMRKKQISRKQRKQRKHNLTGLNFKSLMDLRNQVDEALSGYVNERPLEAVKLSRISWWEGCAPHAREHVEGNEGRAKVS